jgi:uncharacterized membrane protein
MIFHFGHGLHHHGPFHLVVLAVLLVLVVAGGIALLRRWGPGSSRLRAASATHDAPWPARAAFDPALDELRVRYARGEISWQDYVERSANLGYPSPPGPTSFGGPNPPPPPGS